jgi:hypothetical protein
MRILMHRPQILNMLLPRAPHVPALRHARVVLPRMEQIHVLGQGPVESHHAEGLAQVRDPPAVDDGPRLRLGAAPRVPAEGVG